MIGTLDEGTQTQFLGSFHCRFVQLQEAVKRQVRAALILLMRYSGIRISDAVMFRRGSLKDGKLFLQQEKTKHPVLVPLPPFVINAVMVCDEDEEYFFYRPSGRPKTAITDWQW